MKTCSLCKTESVEKLLDMGEQPICSRYLKSPKEREYTHPLVMGQCNNCGLVQLINIISPEKLVPKYEWITYNEPEGHLDDLSKKISILPDITKDSKICGISYKDDSTLSRLNKMGFNKTWRIELKEDLCITEKRANIETIQDRLDSDKADKISNKYGKADIIIARHILEHSNDMHKFMDAIKKLLNPKGYVIVEIPDCSKSLKTKNYTMLWEEHISYFTPETFRCCFSFFGFSLLSLECYPYPFENSLVGIACLKKCISPSLPSRDTIEREKNIARSFSKGINKKRQEIKLLLEKISGKIALFGAGHLTCAFVNFLKLDKYIEFVVDDNPNKKGLFMPGSKIDIKGSDALLNEGIKLCIMSLSPESEEKVIKNNKLFVEKGGVFSSITPSSKYALDKNKEQKNAD